MPDMASVSVVLSSIKTATDIVKFLRETDVSLEKAETKLKLAELVGYKEQELIRLQDCRNDYWECLSCKNSNDLGRGGNGIGRVETEFDSFPS